MKKIILLVFCAFSMNAYCGKYESTVGIVRSMDDRPCILFQLSGVSDVDDTGSAWVALHKDIQGFDQTFSMLLAAKMSDGVVILNTSGSECGHAKATVVHIK